jgi:hemolysin activation/secretion protein
MLLPELGLRTERYDEVSTFRLEASVEGTANRLKSDVDLLGRLQPDRRWVLAKWDFEATQFLEPLLNPRGWSDPSTPGSSTLAHEISLSSNGQWSFDRRLIPQASQVIGGLFSVRGYKNSAATGDSVVVGSLEYRFYLARSLPVRKRPFRLPFLGDVRAVPQQAYGRADWDLVFRAFADVGHTWRYDAPDNSPEGDDTLIGVGVGLELRLGGHLRARMDYARALKDAGPPGDENEAGDDHFHFLFSILY